MRERSLSSVPRPVLLLLATALVIQLAWSDLRTGLQAEAKDLPPPPSASALRLAAFGEPLALSRVLMLWVQSFDTQKGTSIRFDDLDYHRLRAWLEQVMKLDPKTHYPLFAASRLYTEVQDQERLRVIGDFVYREFQNDPDRHWPALAHMSVVAKHRLGDLPLAQQYARAIREKATGPDVPDWASQMGVFILEDMNEFESARILLGGIIAEGKVRNTRELLFLKERLDQLEQKARGVLP